MSNLQGNHKLTGPKQFKRFSSLTEGGRQEDEESPLVAGIVTRGSVKNLPNYKFFKL